MERKIKKVPAIEISKMGGLKCDNPSCDWKDMSIKVEEYKYYINTICPCCGENILTEKDYKAFTLMLKFVRVINFILPKRIPNKEKDVVVTCKFDGSGKVSKSVKSIKGFGN